MQDEHAPLHVEQAVVGAIKPVQLGHQDVDCRHAVEGRRGSIEGKGSAGEMMMMWTDLPAQRMQGQAAHGQAVQRKGMARHAPLPGDPPTPPPSPCHPLTGISHPVGKVCPGGMQVGIHVPLLQQDRAALHAMHSISQTGRGCKSSNEFYQR